MLLDWILTRRNLIRDLEIATREAAAFERRALSAEEANTLLSIRVLDLEHELAGRPPAPPPSLRPRMAPLIGDPGDETGAA